MRQEPPPLDLSLLVGYLFVRSFFIYTRGLKTRLICTHPLKLAALPTHFHPLLSQHSSFKRRDYRSTRPAKPFYPPSPFFALLSLSRPSERRKKINGRIRMNFINWIARRASRFDATRTSFVNAGVTCCNRLFKSSLRLLKKRQTCCRLPFARYHPWLRTVIAADGHGEKVIAVNMEILLAHTVFLRAWGHVIEVSYI